MSHALRLCVTMMKERMEREMGWEAACSLLPIETLKVLADSPPEMWLDGDRAQALFMSRDGGC